MHVMTFALL